MGIIEIFRRKKMYHEGRSLGVSLGFQRNLCEFVKSSVGISNIEKLAAETNPLKNLE